MTARRAGALSIFAVVIAGCGSSSSGSEAPYKAQVDKLCASENAQLEAVPTAGNILSITRQLKDIRQKTLTQIKSIPPPSSISSEVNSWLSVRAQEVAALNQTIAAMNSDNTPSSEFSSLANRREALAKEEQSKAKSLGLSCPELPPAIIQ